MRIGFILCLLLNLSLESKAQYNTPGNNRSWTPDSLVAYSGGVVTFSAGRYTIHQNLRLSATDTLTISQNAVLAIASGCTILINGTLLTNPPNEVLFTAADSNAPYKGFLFENTSSSVIRNTRFEFGGGNKLNYSFVIFENCTFRKNNHDFASGAISLFQSSPVIRQCTFLNNSRSAIMSSANASSSPVITGNQLIRNNVSNGNYPQINLGSGSTDTIIIQNNTIEGFYEMAGGIALSTLAGGNIVARIQNNTVYNNRYGIACIGNNISGLIVGNRVYNNNIQNNPNQGGSGLNFNGNSTNQMIVSKNRIYGNLWGITIQGQAQPMLGNLTHASPFAKGQNIIYNNGNGGILYALYNNTPQSIMAENNFWGSINRDSVELVIVHQPDQTSLGWVDYLPIWDSVPAPSLFVDTITLIRDTLHAGDIASNYLTVRNIGNQNLTLTLKDTFGIQTESYQTKRNRLSAAYHAEFQRLWKKIQMIRRVTQQSSRNQEQNEFIGSLTGAGEAIVITDSSRDYLGRTHGIHRLTYPDILSVDLSVVQSIVTTISCTTTYQTPVDTNIIGVISLDTDQDFMTGLFPPLANLGLVPTDVGSEYELIFTTKPSLYFQYGSITAPAVLIRWLDDSLEIAGASTNITRTGNQVRFSIVSLTPIDPDNKMNIASGFFEVDSTFNLSSFDEYVPNRPPDMAPDIGHGKLGTEKDPAWLGMDILRDTLQPVEEQTFRFFTFGAALPGNYPATVILRTNDPKRPIVRFPYTVTMLPELQPQTNPSFLALTDTLIQDSIKTITVEWYNSGAGTCKFFIADTNRSPWLQIVPRMGWVAGGEMVSINFTFNASGLQPGTYTTPLLVLTNDTTQTVVPVPVHLTVIPSLNSDDKIPSPLKYELLGNYPNPFNPSTTIAYTIAGTEKVQLEIYNILGQKVRTLVHQVQNPGYYRIAWNGTDDNGRAVASGIYIYRMTAGSYDSYKKMLFIK